MSRTIIIGAVLLIAAWPGVMAPASGRAAPVVDEIRVGALYHDVGLWSGTSGEGGIDYNTELVFSPSWSVAGGTVRPLAGFSLNSRGGTSKVYGGGVYEYIWNNGIFIDLGFGLVIHNGETEDEQVTDRNQLGSPILFRISIEPGYAFGRHHRISLMFDHVSNGYLADPNEGLDTLGLRYGFRF